MESVEVYDMYGKLISRVLVNDYTALIDLSSNATGVYIVRAFTDLGIINKRVIKR